MKIEDFNVSDYVEERERVHPSDKDFIGPPQRPMEKYKYFNAKRCLEDLVECLKEVSP